MPSWDSDQYLKFARERTQPSVDLAARIELAEPAHVVDLGSGPGNSTEVLARRWPSAKVTGVDNSPQMLAKARRDYPQWSWAEADISQWKATEPVDLVFANASLQWVPDHETLLPRLLSQVKKGGALAVQIPANFHTGPHKLIRDLASSDKWKTHFPAVQPQWHGRNVAFYYDTLSPLSAGLELWETDYVHVLEGPQGVVEWYKGTGLRPWLEQLKTDADRGRFLADFGAIAAREYPSRPDGRVLFPFRRLFLIAYAK